MEAQPLNTKQAKLVYKIFSAIRAEIAKAKELTGELIMLNALLVNTEDFCAIIDSDIEIQKKIDNVMAMAKQELADYERTA